MRNRTIVTVGGAASTLGLVAAAAAQVSTATPGSLTYMVDGGLPVSVALLGDKLPNGSTKYVATVDAAPGLQLVLQYVVDDFSDPIASMNGQFKCVNTSGATHGVEAKVEFDLCPVLVGGTKVGGTVAVMLTANSDGGSITCLPGADYLWQTWVGEQMAHGLYFCPFQLATTGAGTIQGNTAFGTPIPSKSGPPSAPSLGTRNRFNITNGESFTITSNVVVKSLGASSPCASDVNADGATDAFDLATIMGQWGSPDSNCAAADVNGDGIIDGLDLSQALGNWGPCSE